ncbi:MAG: 3-phosphoshikimate 1-carboxyvinyltransferase [Candidatus Marinimicrobia bacterium]|nr:3-phosphoshikimate 1-carboxyvinyltransferase [Candidatus Neomarinimicrobiota bacterium]
MVLKGSVTLPGDKSLSHRAIMLASLSSDKSVIENLSSGQDVISTRDCLAKCGMDWSQDGEQINIKGRHFISPATPLDCGNSGTTVRLLSGLIAGERINATFTGDQSLSSRPMDRVVSPLQKMNAKISSTDGKLPVIIQASDLHSIEYTMPVASAQVKSAIMLAGIHAVGETIIHETVPTRDHTEILLSALGYPITTNGQRIAIKGSDTRHPGFHFHVPADPSSAAFFATGAAIIHDSEVIFKNMLINPTRFGFFRSLGMLGAQVDILDHWTELHESVADIRIKSGQLHAVHIAKEDVPALIDELPLIAILATQAEGTTTVEGAGELRVKESDRLHAICINLERMGAQVTEHTDGFSISGPTSLTGIHVQTFHDHRIAMAFTIAGLIADGETTLDDSDCIAISFPEFHNVLNYLTLN